MYGTARATSRGQGTTSWARNVLALHASTPRPRRLGRPQVLPASCANQQSKTDAGLDDDLWLFVSARDPVADPSQSEFFSRNINEVAGLASDCDPSKPDSAASTAACQLGLEKHANFERDCKGFLRAPRFCDSSGEAMGTGCWKVPETMNAGRYVGQWYWRTSFLRPDADNLQTLSYQSCFDFQVVPAGTTAGTPGTTGVPDSDLPCTNNVLAFADVVRGPSTRPTAEPTDAAPTAEPTNAARTAEPTDASPTAEPTDASPATPSAEPTTLSAEAVGPWGHCAMPSFVNEKRCPANYACVRWAGSPAYGRCQPVEAAEPTNKPTTTPPTAESSVEPSSLETSCSTKPWEHCADPLLLEELCCPASYTCVRAPNSPAYGRCQPSTY